MQKRKGFTLVELVIVIAVIAILAGVLIGTFASVINRANESAKLQEMKAAEIEQKSNDILEKLDNAKWFGWEDLETKISEALSNVNVSVNNELTETSVKNAVQQVLNEYAKAHSNDNTGLTEEQVKYVVENALKGQLTEVQVKAIVTQAQQGITNSQLTESQVKTIVEASAANRLTPAQVKAVITECIANVSTLSEAQVKTIVSETVAQNVAGLSILTAAQVKEIIDEAFKNYTIVTKPVSSSQDLVSALTLQSENGKTVVAQLTSDVVVPTQSTKIITIANNTVLDTNGHTIDIGENKLVVTGGVTLTIDDAKVHAGARVFEADTNSNVVINDVEVVGGFKNTAAVQVKQGASLTINGGSFGVNDGAYYCVYPFEKSTVIINDGEFNASLATNGSYSKEATFIINGGTFNVTSDDSESANLYLPCGNTYIYGGTFITSGSTCIVSCGGKLEVLGGTFKTGKTGTALPIETGKGWYTSSGYASADATILVCTNRQGYIPNVVTIDKTKVTFNTYAGNEDIQVWSDRDTKVADKTQWSSVGVTVIE